MPMTNAAEYLERTAARVPDKIAFSDAFGSLTFGQLLTRARALGTVLAGLPGCKNAPVAVLTGRTVQSVAALQGVLQSGNYYVPIDEQMPEARMRRILTQVHARAIVFSESSRPQAERLMDCAPLVCLEEAEKTAPDDALLQARREQIIDLDPVYLLFTSGSTGTPKGIVISHRAILDFTDWLTDFCGYTEHEVFGNQSPFYFDTSCKDLYQTLKLGATCVILEKKFFALPLFLLQALDQHGVTAVNWATSAFHLAASSGALERCVPHALRKIVVGGEALQARYVNMWKRAIPEADLYNMYGPTETTVDCAALHLTRAYRDDEPIPIGKACRNMQLLLLKDDLTEAAPGETANYACAAPGLRRDILPTRKRPMQPLSRTRSAPITATFSTARAIWPCSARTEISIFLPAATGRLSTWATASNWAKLKRRSTVSIACTTPSASTTQCATRSSASMRAIWTPIHLQRRCGRRCRNICCRTSMKSWRRCRTTPTASLTVRR